MYKKNYFRIQILPDVQQHQIRFRLCQVQYKISDQVAAFDV